MERGRRFMRDPSLLLEVILLWRMASVARWLRWAMERGRRLMRDPSLSPELKLLWRMDYATRRLSGSLILASGCYNNFRRNIWISISLNTRTGSTWAFTLRIRLLRALLG